MSPQNARLYVLLIVSNLERIFENPQSDECVYNTIIYAVYYDYTYQFSVIGFV